MANTVIQTSAPVVEPVSLNTQKNWMKISYDYDDAIISQIISAAREYCELATKLKFITQSYTLYADNIYDLINERRTDNWVPWLYWGAIWLPYPPLQSIQSIQYMGANGTMLTWDPSLYIVSTYIPGRVAPQWAQLYPIIQRYVLNAFQVNFTVGFGATGTQVPFRYLQAIMTLAHYWYENRTSTEVPEGIDRMLDTAEYGFTA